MAQHSNPNHRRKTIQLSGAEQRFLTTWRRHAGVSRETEERWEPAAHNSYGGAGVSVVMNGSRCSWQCPLTCSIKYLPGCTNDCLESRRWCLKYADVSETSASTDADDLDNCIESFPMCTGQRKDDTTGPFRHLDDLGTPSKRFLAGKHVRLPPSSAGAFVFRRTLESVSRRDQQSTEGFGESENYDETELVDSVSHVVVGEPKAAPEATSVEISKTPDEGGRFRGGSRQKLRACRIISDASTDCDGNSEDGTSYSPVAVGDSLKDGENIKLQKRSSALRK
ncbi:hypothetical protein TGVEG_269315 [Toxoplasma gondii VEG]|uniref:Uncharacterized protein n=3 Tax=Toxoplasma gondii TaxID=5811 RepID=V4ZWV3_TOXGV|nr:hypothetical protein TGVEG_269315 [Toxoplasma gondii VEG]KFG52393.1 hypothetical protein TGP89_269315 [Toxoplasma gondii p89]PUA87765.1 hypothetical protein TGBR9_269315 [Toxoplasma gondii TgCATBr9]CEL75409.1 TPA: hypothetical protein BN1205_016415 [Toxoplasma gondii VEG]